MNTAERRAALTGRVALLLAAFACGVTASLAAEPTSPVLTVVAAALAGASCLTPLAVRIGRALKPRSSADAERPPFA